MECVEVRVQVLVREKRETSASMSYQNIIGWQKSMDLVVKVYEVTLKLPNSEKIGLFQQMRRVSTIIPSNIAEGYGRFTKADFARFIDIALGSTRELQTQLQICHRLKYGDTGDLVLKADEVARIIFGLVQSLRKM